MRCDRRKFITSLGATGLSLAAANIAQSQQREWSNPELTAADDVTPATQRAINRGLEYLARRQNEEGAFGTSGYGRNVAVCALAGMAFMSGGSTPGRGIYGGNVERCVAYILAHAQERGFIVAEGSTSHGPMYGHGFATLFLAEVFGMTQRMDVGETLDRAVRLIVSSQNREGGWRYFPEPKDADISVTVCQIMALRAARNAGIAVPPDVVDRCIDYVKRSQNLDGGFMYMIEGGPSAFPRSAAGVVALYSAGIYEGEEISKGLNYLMQNIPRANLLSRESYYFYGHYYAVQAMWQAGGNYWEEWFPAIRDQLLTRQRDDGSWLDSTCPELGTALACLILQMPNNYLPIFQR